MSRAKRMGIDIDAAEMPETIGGEWLIEDLFAAGGVASDAMGVRGLAWGELEAWARMTRTSLEPWEADALYRLSAAYAAALDALLAGETAEGLSMLRDLVHASISFKALAQQTGCDEKTLHRTLSSRGNPTTRTLAKIVAAIRDDLGFVPTVHVAMA